jgi:ribosomal protein S18 acetylase RimI-like enzyme
MRAAETPFAPKTPDPSLNREGSSCLIPVRAPLLRKYRFKESDLDLPEVQDFCCGPNPWEQEVAVWIKSRTGDNSVLEDVNRYGLEVWLYRTEAGDLVGYSSLGTNTWSLPMPDGPKHLINYLPFLGVHQNFQGEPKDAPRDDKYAYQILDDLIEYAAARTATHPALQPYIGLSVDGRNRRAIQFYLNRGFADTKSPRKDKKSGVVYERMVLNISSLVTSPLPSPPPDEAGGPG